MKRHVKPREERKQLSVCISVKTIEAIDNIALQRRWTRLQAIRELLDGLVTILKRSGQDKGNWHSLEDLEICQISDIIERKNKPQSIHDQ